jgi:uncharacterized membrane protein YqjE
MEPEPFGTRGPLRDAAAGTAGAGSTGGEPSLGELFKRLTADTTELVRQEISLARAEVRQVGGTVARDGTKLGIAAGLALCGALAVTAFLVIAVGDLLNNYWLGALVVGLVLLAVGGVLARNAVADLKRGVVPEQTLGSLREDAAWAKQETREVKRELTR